MSVSSCLGRKPGTPWRPGDLSWVLKEFPYLTGVGRRMHHITGQTDLPGKEMLYAYDVKKCVQTHEASLNPRLRTTRDTEVSAEKKSKESSSWCGPPQGSSLSVTMVMRQAHMKKMAQKELQHRVASPRSLGENRSRASHTQTPQV